MKKEELIKDLENAKAFTSLVDIDRMIGLINSLETPKSTTLSREMIDEISQRIESCLNNNSEDLVDKDNITFNVCYGNQLEVEDIEIDVHGTMDYIINILEEYEEDEPEETPQLNSNGDEVGLVQSAMNEFSQLSNQ